ncbi:MAG: hypothetical protein Q8N05_21000 [Bacteroidota bacterium]|nr:hypothetical protein [Bacteroidota bacterium]
MNEHFDTNSSSVIKTPIYSMPVVQIRIMRMLMRYRVMSMSMKMRMPFAFRNLFAIVRMGMMPISVLMVMNVLHIYHSYCIRYTISR